MVMHDRDYPLTKDQYFRMALMSKRKMKDHFSIGDVAEYLSACGWKVQSTDSDGTNRSDVSVRYRAQHGDMTVDGLRSADALYRISERMQTTLRGLFIKVIEHSGGLKEADRTPKRNHPPNSQFDR
jgi:hypothetical protein